MTQKEFKEGWLYWLELPPKPTTRGCWARTAVGVRAMEGPKRSIKGSVQPTPLRRGHLTLTPGPTCASQGSYYCDYDDCCSNNCEPELWLERDSIFRFPFRWHDLPSTSHHHNANELRWIECHIYVCMYMCRDFLRAGSCSGSQRRMFPR